MSARIGKRRLSECTKYYLSGKFRNVSTPKVWMKIHPQQRGQFKCSTAIRKCCKSVALLIWDNLDLSFGMFVPEIMLKYTVSVLCVILIICFINFLFSYILEIKKKSYFFFKCMFFDIQPYKCRIRNNVYKMLPHVRFTSFKKTKSNRNKLKLLNILNAKFRAF